MINKTPIDATLQPQLDTLNEEVNAVLAKRKAWMDAHMEDFSNFKVGDAVYDGNTGRLLGKVSRLYRYWEDRDPRYDTSMSIEIEYRVAGTRNYVANSSRHAGCGPDFMTKSEVASAMKTKADYAAWVARGEPWEELFK